MDRIIASNRITGAVVKVSTPAEIDDGCPQNFQARSECFAAVVFQAVDNSTGMLVSTLPMLYVRELMPPCRLIRYVGILA